MADKVQDFFSALDDRAGDDEPVFKMGTVDSLYSGSGRPKVLFDGETVMSSKTYPYINTPAAGNRVLCARAGHTWVVVGVIH